MPRTPSLTDVRAGCRCAPARCSSTVAFWSASSTRRSETSPCGRSRRRTWRRGGMPCQLTGRRRTLIATRCFGPSSLRLPARGSARARASGRIHAWSRELA
ncbi:hypothetical protein [Ornithinimicrobium kibberense]|uniref:hypothetical protein n=1 Tax=Ornithinimicrobium kibberense TaxID=282060 RepID=UPI00360A09C5